MFQGAAFSITSMFDLRNMKGLIMGLFQIPSMPETKSTHLHEEGPTQTSQLFAISQGRT